mgnify:CR=1 FL=1
MTSKYNFNIFETKNFSLVGSFNIIFGKNKQIGVLKMNKAQFTTSHIIEVNNEFFLDEDVVFGGINSIINSGKTFIKLIKDQIRNRTKVKATEQYSREKIMKLYGEKEVGVFLNMEISISARGWHLFMFP